MNLILLPQQGGHCVGGQLEQHNSVVLAAAHQDLVLCHCSDAKWIKQQWAGKRLVDFQALIYLCYYLGTII